MELIPEGSKIVMCSPSDVVGSYVGQSAPLMRAKIEEARGGVLFIDEAYGLMSSQFGLESITELVKLCTDEAVASSTAIIVAGYEDEIDRLMATNPGLESRFPHKVRLFCLVHRLNFTDTEPGGL